MWVAMLNMRLISITEPVSMQSKETVEKKCLGVIRMLKEIGIPPADRNQTHFCKMLLRKSRMRYENNLRGWYNAGNYESP